MSWRVYFDRDGHVTLPGGAPTLAEMNETWPGSAPWRIFDFDPETNTWTEVKP